MRFQKGPGFSWQWAQQGGTNILGMTLSATTFVDDNGVRRMDVFAFSIISNGPKLRLVHHFWKGSEWNWADIASFPGHSYDNQSFTTVTNYIDYNVHRRMEVFCGAQDEETGGPDELIRHAWVAGAWIVKDLDGFVDKYASTVNLTDTDGVIHVYTFVISPTFHQVWKNFGPAFGEVGILAAAVGKPEGFLTAIAYNDTSGFPG